MKIASATNKAKSSAAHAFHAENPETVILFAVANQLFAIAADSVQEIRSTDSLSVAANEIERPELPKVRHTFERNRPHQYYVVNAGAHFGLPVTRPALVLILRQLRVALLVDRIERMAEIPGVYPLPLAFTGEERRWYRGLAYVERHVQFPWSIREGSSPRRNSTASIAPHKRPRPRRERSGGAAHEAARSQPALENATPDSFVLLQIAGRRFALAASTIAELAPPVRLHAFPHGSPLLTGVIVRRGRIVPVFDASRVLGGKSPLSATGFILIARQRFGDADRTGAIPVEWRMRTGQRRTRSRRRGPAQLRDL